MGALVEDMCRAADLLAAADGLLIAAGAGMGVDSGLPDFRGNAGFWNAYPALGAAGTPFMDVAYRTKGSRLCCDGPEA